MSSSSLYAAFELGGTTCVVGLLEDDESVLCRHEVPTTVPDETLSALLDWLVEQLQKRSRKLSGIGVASFGPLDLNTSSATYGYITTTPKPHWANTDLLTPIKTKLETLSCSSSSSSCSLAIGFDTDVNAAAVAHLQLARANGAGDDSCAYVTVGTGVGVGVVVGGAPVHGLLHPEMGHIRVERRPGDTFDGVCPFHGSCVEGMVAAGGLAKRAGVKPAELAALSDDDDVWDAAAYYLGQMAATLLLTASPSLIVFGGGILKRPALLPMIRKHTLDSIAGYLAHELVSEQHIDRLIVATPYGDNAGLLGAFHLAKNK
jgi:fructokinase